MQMKDRSIPAAAVDKAGTNDRRPTENQRHGAEIRDRSHITDTLQLHTSFFAQNGGNYLFISVGV